MAKIAIVYHSTFGHTKNLAEAVANGARQVSSDVTLLSVDELGADAPGWAVLDAADAIIFGSPTYMGGYSAQFKAFIDAASTRWYRQAWKDKFAAGFTNSGSFSGDKFNTLVGLATNAMQHGMIWISLGLHPAIATDIEGPTADMVNRSGAFFGAMGSSFRVGPEGAPSVGDLKTGEILGERVATLATKFLAGK